MLFLRSQLRDHVVYGRRQKLRDFVGTWTGTEKLYPTRWRPQEVETKGVFTFRMGLGDTYLIMDYLQSHPTEGQFFGMCLYGWSESKQAYSMHWFDAYDEGACTLPPLGRWLDGALVFSREDEGRLMRFVHQLVEDRYIFRIELGDGTAWQKVQEGEYRRA